MTINVVVIDDHTLVREAVCRMIDSEDDLKVVGQAGGIAEGKAVLAANLIHVLVVDVSMPDGSGLVLARAAREASPRLGIVVLTMHKQTLTAQSAARTVDITPRDPPGRRCDRRAPRTSARCL